MSPGPLEADRESPPLPSTKQPSHGLQVMRPWWPVVHLRCKPLIEGIIRSTGWYDAAPRPLLLPTVGLGADQDLSRSRLPSEIHAEVLVKPPIVRLEVLFQPPPGGRVHLRIPILALRNRLEHRGFGLPIR